MKIKQDFVTNSSSICYIVLLPENFQVKTEDEEMNKKFELYLNELEEKGEVEFGYWAEFNLDFSDITDMEEFVEQVYQDIVSKYLIKKIDFGADYPDKIVNLNSKQIKEKIKEKINEN
jgi:hypothetical protein